MQRQTGEWDRAVEMAREVLAAADAPLNARAIASGMLGWILATRGDASRATAPLLEGLALAPRAGNVAMELECLAALGSLDERAGSPERALERARLVYERWQGSGLQHYAIPSLLWATTCCASLGFASDARACTSALAEVAAGLGHAEALAALACALGELSLLDGAPAQAASQFKQALDLVRDVGLPYQVADVSLRTGLGLVAAGAPVAGLDHLAVAHHGAQRLGARPLAWRVAREMAALGEPVRRHLGRRAAGHLARGGLSHRELEVVRLIAVGQTNQEIGRELYLSTRTLDMHVRNLLAKLGSRSRAEATHRAGELGLLAPLETYPAGHASQVLVQDRGSYE